MEAVSLWLMAGGLLMFLAILLGAAFSARLGIPSLLVFLFVGMLAGVDGPGRVEFDNFELAFLVANLALAVILFDGGLRTRLATFRVGLWPALTLATVGVVITAALTGALAVGLFSWPWQSALLLGAIIASTDAAAVFALLNTSGLRLNERVWSTLEIESGLNDPMAVFLTIVLVALALDPSRPLGGTALMLEFVRQFGLGAALGGVFGWALSALVRRFPMDGALRALMICAAGVGSFGAATWLGGSGFLAVYLVGLIVGNRGAPISVSTLRVMDGLAWLAQAGMFLLLGLLVTPHELPSLLVPSLVISAFLIVVARPVAVAVGLLPYRFRANEIGYAGWVGLRGAVPIVLAMYPLLSGVPGAKLLFNVAFVVVLSSLLLQGTSVAAAARLFKVVLPARAEPRARVVLTDPAGEPVEVALFRLEASSRAEGSRLADLSLPQGCRLVAVLRGGEPLDPRDAGAFLPDDDLMLVGPEAAIEHVRDLLAPSTDQSNRERVQAFGEFVLDADVRAADALPLYGVAVEGEESLADFVAQRLRRKPVVGDAVTTARVVLTVVELLDGRVHRIGLKLPPMQVPTGNRKG